jgi:hypothetical protein
VTVFLAWTSEAVADLEGPWREARRVAPGVLLVDSPESLSEVYHALKWSLPDGASLVVSAVEQLPKSRGLAPGTTAWLRRRLPSASDGVSP